MSKSRWDIMMDKIKSKYSSRHKPLQYNKKKQCCTPKPKSPENTNPCVMVLKRTSQKLFGTVDKWDELYFLLEAQNFTCPYLGVELKLGVNTSIDHIIPRAMGGTDDFDNLQWVDRRINWMKGPCTHIGFLSLVKQVAEYTQIMKKSP